MVTGITRGQPFFLFDFQLFTSSRKNIKENLRDSLWPSWFNKNRVNLPALSKRSASKGCPRWLKKSVFICGICGK